MTSHPAVRRTTPGQAPSSSDAMSRFRAIVYQESGIALQETKDTMIQQRLSKRMRAIGMTNLDSYLKRILGDESFRAERTAAVQAMTTNTTYFFREPVHFEVLQDTIVPELFQNNPRSDRTVRIWSVAASEGAEAYTAAMAMEVLREIYPLTDYEIIGTDFSHKMLTRASRGVYKLEQLEGIPLSLRRKYVQTSKDPKFMDYGRIADSIRSRCQFRHLNLMESPYALPNNFDVAFLRNVLIYFTPADQKKVISSVIKHLVPGGYLIVGHSECMAVQRDDLTALRPTIYRKSLT